MEDEKIIELYFLRCEDAISETKSKYGGLCLSLSTRLLGSKADAEECLSDTLLGVWNRIPPERPESLKNFVCRIARNQALKRLRHDTAKKRDRALSVPLDELTDILPDTSISPDTLDSDLSALLDTFLRTLPPDPRDMFIRRYWFFESLGEISALFGCSESRVKSSLHRTREKLRAFLQSEGVYI